MNQKKEVTLAKHIMVIASIILNDEEESKKVDKIASIIKDSALDLSTKISLFSGQTCLHLTVEKNLVQVASLLIHSGADINATDWDKRTPLHNAARRGLDKMVILFYQANLDVCGGKRLETPLHIAVRKNFPACVEVLISFARPANSSAKNIDNKTPMDLIEEQMDAQSKKVLLQAFIPNSEPKGLYTAIANKNWTAVFDYINSGLPVGVTYANQSSAIIQAAENGLADILLLLCQQPDIDMNATDEQGETALHKSIRYKHIDCIKILVTALKPVNRNTRNNLGKTAGDLLVELHNTSDQNALREALVYLPPKKRIPDYETNFFTSCDKKNASVRPDSWISANFKCLELDKLYHAKMPSSAITGNDLAQDEKKLHKLLLGYGLETSYPESEVISFSKTDFQKMAAGVGSEFPVSVPCLQAIYDICTGKKIARKLQINIQDIHASTLGLLGLHEPLDIIRSLMLLSSKFCNHQHLIGNLLVKNIIISSFEFGYDLTEKRLDETLRLYLKNYCLSDISQVMLTSLNRVTEPGSDSVIHKSLPVKLSIDDADNIFDTIQGILNTKEEIRKDDCRYLAREISNLTLEFYQTCFPKSYSYNRNKLNPDDCFFVKKEQFNMLTSFIIYIILQQKSTKSRARAVTLFALVAKECIHLEPMPDLNSSSFIMSALCAAPISRLNISFGLIDRKNIKIIDALRTLFNPSGNYKLLRELSKSFPDSLPYIGVILRDITMLEESNDLYESLQFLGQIYHPIVSLKKRIDAFQITSKSDLLFQMKKFFLFDKDVFFDLSCLYEPDVLDLSKNFKLESFNTMLTQFKNNNIPLMVMYDSKCIQGSKALDHISSWLKSMVKSNQIGNAKADEIYNDCKMYVSNFNNENYSKQIEATHSKFKFFVGDVPRAPLTNTNDTMDYSV